MTVYNKNYPNAFVHWIYRSTIKPRKFPMLGFKTKKSKIKQLSFV